MSTFFYETKINIVLCFHLAASRSVAQRRAASSSVEQRRAASSSVEQRRAASSSVEQMLINVYVFL
jgi:hypothetical protein